MYQRHKCKAFEKIIHIYVSYLYSYLRFVSLLQQSLNRSKSQHYQQQQLLQGQWPQNSPPQLRTFRLQPQQSLYQQQLQQQH